VLKRASTLRSSRTLWNASAENGDGVLQFSPIQLFSSVPRCCWDKFRRCNTGRLRSRRPRVHSWCRQSRVDSRTDSRRDRRYDRRLRSYTADASCSSSSLQCHHHARNLSITHPHWLRALLAVSPTLIIFYCVIQCYGNNTTRLQLKKTSPTHLYDKLTHSNWHHYFLLRNNTASILS